MAQILYIFCEPVSIVWQLVFSYFKAGLYILIYLILYRLHKLDNSNMCIQTTLRDLYIYELDEGDFHRLISFMLVSTIAHGDI